MWLTWFKLSVCIWLYIRVVSGCIFGDDGNCAFPCNCEDDNDKCDEVTGECHRGCKQWDTTPDKTQGRFHWGGLGCRTGNVAFEKYASQCKDYKPQYLADKAVDGRLQTDGGDSSACQHTNFNCGVNNPWWQVDLGAPHVVYDVTVFTRISYAYRSRYIKIGVGLTSDVTQHPDCAISNQSIDVSVTLPCSQPLTGRYVSVVRYDSHKDKILNMCEVIVMGHSILNADCRRCSNDTFTCNNKVGCRKCNGYLPPLCTQVCTRGKYGVNCGGSCATHHCINGSDTCNHLDGSCPDGCMDWYLNDTCSLYIDLPRFDDTATVTAMTIDDQTVQLAWQTAGGMTPGLDRHYGYIIQYRTEDTFTNIRNVTQQEDNNIIVADGLQRNTLYTFRVSVYRQFGDIIDISTTGSLDVDVRTTCTACGSTYGMAAGVAVSCVVFVGIVIAVIVLCRRRSAKRPDPSADSLSNDLCTKLATAASPEDKPVGVVNPVGKPDIASKPAKHQINCVMEQSRSEIDIVTDDTEIDSPPSTPAVSSVRHTRPTSSDNQGAMPVAVSVSGLKSHIAQLSSKFQTEITSSDGTSETVTIDGFEVEFERLPGVDFKPHKFGQLPQNKIKNRFKNIQPFDESRVVLHTDGDPEASDYINASYISPYDEAQNKYIASQGPLQETVVDFWRMIWQEKCNRIIMLAQLVENGKRRCEQYWPENKGKSAATMYGPFRVTLLDEQVHAEYAYRRLGVDFNGQSREVHHFHLLTWPDKSVPQDNFPLLSLRGRVNRPPIGDQSPLVVHCSAGVGRTGTFIALDYLLNQARCEGKVDVFGCVHLMRTQRNLMVQTKLQYKFLHKALIEGIDTRVDETAIPYINFIDEYSKLASESEYSNMNPIMEQFEVMKKNKPIMHSSKHSSALLPENISKNRSKAILPADRFRPSLHTPHSDGNDFINAVFVDSFDRHNGLILTQAPLPNTVVDFWRLVYDQDCDCIIMLDDADHDDKLCPQYWPTNQTLKQSYGPISVELIKFDNTQNAGVVWREFRIVKKTKLAMNTESRIVHQFHLSNWPQSDVACSMGNLISSVQLVNECREDGRTIVHCRNGASHCGLFAACWYVLDVMKAEQEVDVFLASRVITSRCPQALSTMEQYHTLYELAKCYISGFQTYANI